MGCREFFERVHPDGVCKALQHEGVATQLAWELETASIHSPGPIQPGEVLCRQVMNPVYIESSSGNVKPTLFDDASSIGASVDRLAFIAELDLHALGRARAERDNLAPPKTGMRTYMGYVPVTSDEVRAIFQDIEVGPPRPGLGAYDTALPDRRSHADICQLVAAKSAGRSIRQRLFELAKGRMVRSA